MNLLLLETADFIDTDTVFVSDTRLSHICNVLDAKIGDFLTVGLLNGNIGKGKIQELDESRAKLTVVLDTQPPPPLNLTVILALPRPKMLRRILRNIAELGIKELYLINSYKVEKSYWQTPVLDEETITTYLKDGLMQAKDTVLPRVYLKKRFKPFILDEIKGIIANKNAFVAHPYATQSLPEPSHEARVIFIGPEGGFIDYEIDLIQQQGVQAVQMGQRIYRVENALTLLSMQLGKFP